MRTSANKKIILGCAGILLSSVLHTGMAFSQITVTSPLQLSLDEAISKARVSSKRVLVSKTEKVAADEDLEDANLSALPGINTSGSYQRFTKLTLYTDGLSDSHSIPKYPGPNGADLGINASFNVYSGGKTRAFQAEQQYKSALSEVGVSETGGNISLQVATNYLDMIRLSGLNRLIKDQIVRAETRLRNINALYRNQKVTRSDVLRAELMLSTVKLNLEQTKNDIIIANRKLNVLMAVPEDVVVLTSDTLESRYPDHAEINNLAQSTSTGAYAMLKYDEQMKIQTARVKGLKSNYYPSLSLISAYGFNYPNNLFFPPVDQAYSIGFIGFRVQYNLSSIYQNKHKVTGANVRLRSLEIQKSELQDELHREAGSLSLKYGEALNRITVAGQQIEQATANYKIVSAKYYNQLALLTDLLDADNLLQESRYNLIQAQTNLKFLVYRLQYLSGKL